MNEKRQYPPTLCWDCANATGACSWSDELKPIKGWKALPTIRIDERGVEHKSFVIYECPEFKRDAISGGLKRYKGEITIELVQGRHQG